MGSALAQQTPPAQTPPDAPAAAQAQQAPPAQAPDTSGLATPKDKFSYALGMNLGTNLQKQSVPVDPDLILQGLKDAMSGGKTRLTDDEAHAALMAMQNTVRQQQMEKMQQQGEANKKEGAAFLAENKTKEGVVTLPSGLQYKILKAGVGPKPTASDTVVCNYRGTFINGTEFDSSYKRGQPATFPVNGVIKAWTQALELMPVGSKWQLFVPADLAYGERGAPPDITPNATLLFDVELISIQKKPSLEKKPAPATTTAPPKK